MRSGDLQVPARLAEEAGAVVSRDVVEWNSIRIVHDPLVVPVQFYRRGSRLNGADALAAAMNAAGFDVAVDPDEVYWLAWVDRSVNETIALVDHAFPGATDEAAYAWLTWRVHVDDAVWAAQRLGGDEAALALLTSVWVDAQDRR